MSGASWALNEYRHLSTTTHTELMVNEVLEKSTHAVVSSISNPSGFLKCGVISSTTHLVMLCQKYLTPLKKHLTIHQIIFPSFVSLLNVISTPLKALWKIIDKNAELQGTKAEACGIPLETLLQVDISCIKSAFLGSSLGWLQNHLITLSLSLLSHLIHLVNALLKCRYTYGYRIPLM